MVEDFREKALRIKFQKGKINPKFNNDIKQITMRQKESMKKLIKDPTQPPFVKMDARARLKRLEKLK